MCAQRIRNLCALSNEMEEQNGASKGMEGIQNEGAAEKHTREGILVVCVTVLAVKDEDHL